MVVVKYTLLYVHENHKILDKNPTTAIRNKMYKKKQKKQQQQKNKTSTVTALDNTIYLITKAKVE